MEIGKQLFFLKVYNKPTAHPRRGRRQNSRLKNLLGIKFIDEKSCQMFKGSDEDWNNYDHNSLETNRDSLKIIIAVL